MQCVWKDTEQVVLLCFSFQHKKFPWVLCGWGCFCKERSCRSYSNCTARGPVKLGNMLCESTVHKTQWMLCFLLPFVSRGQVLQGEQRDNERPGFVHCNIWFPSGAIGTVLASYNTENFPLHAAVRVEQSPSASWDTPDRQSRAKILYSGWQDWHFLILKVFWWLSKIPKHI